jgi:hypothetical protein
MPKTAITTTTTTEVLQRQKKAIDKRQAEIKGFTQEAFVDADEIDALMEGANLDGYKIKLVQGSSTKLDEAKLVRLGCDPEWLQKARVTKMNNPYVRITAPGEDE